DLGFFNQAAAHPDAVALVDPSEREITWGELASRANQVSNGLRALGLDRGDTVAIVVPNSIEMLEVYLGATQIGCYITPINHHLVGPEIAYIVSDSDAKVLVGHERFAHALTSALAESGLSPDRAFAIGTVEGFRPYGDLVEAQPDTRPE